MNPINKKLNNKRIIIQQRDIQIFDFLNRVGYALVKQITTRITNINDMQLIATETSIQQRLYALVASRYLKVIKTTHGNYYVLDKFAKLDNKLIISIKINELEHHNFLTDLFLFTANEMVVSEREVIYQFKDFGKLGHIPDMIINNWIIEYERTPKSADACKAKIDFWTLDNNRNLCVIYANNRIRDNYAKFVNQKVKLVSQENYQDILAIINNQECKSSIENYTIHQKSILDKFVIAKKDA